MRNGTLLVLVCLVGILYWATRSAEQTALGGPDSFDYALFPGFTADAVVGVRVDNLERSEQWRIERDANGLWFLTDPVPYRAQADLVRSLLQEVQRSRGVLEPDVDPAEVDLEPPLIVLELTLAGGDELRLEIGAVDVDPHRVFVSIPGHPVLGPQAAGNAALMRAPRPLYNALDCDARAFRDRRLTPFLGSSLVSLRRVGSMPDPETGVRRALGFEALLEEGGWWRPSPRVRLDPSTFGVLARGAALVRAREFVRDGVSDLSPYGLDQPAFEIEIEDRRGTRVRLLFAPRAGDPNRWYATRQGSTHVVAVATHDVERLALAADKLYDFRLQRAPRDEILRVEFERGGEVLELERREDDWWVSIQGRGDQFPAAHGLVNDLLTMLERHELGEYEPELAFAPAEPPRSLRILAADGTLWGGQIGAPYRNAASGAEGWQYLRFGDELVALIGEDALVWVDRPLDELRRRQLHRYAESQVDEVRLTLRTAGGDEGRERRYRRGGPDGVHWFPAGVKTHLPAGSPFFGVLERICNLRATRWLSAAPAGQGSSVPRRVLEREVDVVLSGSFAGKTRRFTVGETRAGVVVCRLSRGQDAELERELFDFLLELLGEGS